MAESRRATASVIILNWNGLAYLKECLAALEVQTRKPDEIIVVDNGSSDGSQAYLETRRDVQSVLLDANVGFSAGNAAGYRLATSCYVVLLNNDTAPSPEWLEELIACADLRDEVGIVASLMTDWTGTFIDTAGDACTVSGRGLKRLEGEPVDGRIRSEPVFSGCAGAVLYKRSMLDQVGFLDERFFVNSEDTDLAFRANLHGWRAYLNADAIVRHRISASQGAFSRTAVYYSARNHVWTWFKNMPTPLMLWYAPALLVDIVVTMGSFALRGRGGAGLRGYLAGIRGLSQFAADRQSIQRARRVPLRELRRRLTPVSVMLLAKLRRAWHRSKL